ncbi:hypothetical protein DEGR_38630 (plasmid) [Deinococcus grandis]|nr:hypothetical protein DEGR_38630 [Deinococcus grandis]
MGAEEAEVVAVGGVEDGFEVADVLGGGALEEVSVVEGGDEGVGVGVAEGLGDLLGELVVGVGHVNEFIWRHITKGCDKAPLLFFVTPASTTVRECQRHLFNLSLGCVGSRGRSTHG